MPDAMETLVSAPAGLAELLDKATRAALHRHEIACQQEAALSRGGDERAHARALATTAGTRRDLYEALAAAVAPMLAGAEEREAGWRARCEEAREMRDAVIANPGLASATVGRLLAENESLCAALADAARERDEARALVEEFRLDAGLLREQRKRLIRERDEALALCEKMEEIATGVEADKAAAWADAPVAPAEEEG